MISSQKTASSLFWKAVVEAAVPVVEQHVEATPVKVSAIAPISSGMAIQRILGLEVRDDEPPPVAEERANLLHAGEILSARTVALQL